MVVANPIIITVDNDFARFGAKSYAINKINTVEVRERQPHDRGLAIILGIVSAVFAYGGVKQLGNAEITGAIVSLILAMALAWACHWAWQRSKIREYQLFLMTSSSSTQAYISNDQNEIMELRDTIEAAMVGKSES